MKSLRNKNLNVTEPSPWPLISNQWWSETDSDSIKLQQQQQQQWDAAAAAAARTANETAHFGLVTCENSNPIYLADFSCRERVLSIGNSDCNGNVMLVMRIVAVSAIQDGYNRMCSGSNVGLFCNNCLGTLAAAAAPWVFAPAGSATGPRGCFEYGNLCCLFSTFF
ncbi:unnamed protein product [Onchocerca flexuosa]|uniref:Uncharacterized protein n=1 Tax=Onchocerca flexuosa TaxID=387005 RepID=A0A183I3Z1_9BILA|nr:unnamed protein product [Onchocerca flexuosa]